MSLIFLVMMLLWRSELTTIHAKETTIQITLPQLYMSNNDIVDIDDPDNPMLLKFSTDIGPDPPTLGFLGEIYCNNCPTGDRELIKVINRDNNRSICNDYPGLEHVWEDVTAKIVRKVFTPFNSCPIKKGIYTFNNPITPLVVDFITDIMCGTWKLYIEVNYVTKFVNYVEYNFELTHENSECVDEIAYPK